MKLLIIGQECKMMLYNTAREQTTNKNKYRLLLNKEGKMTLKRKEK